jgi:Na+/proline symporter
VVLLGCWALYQAVYAESILEKMLYAYTVYSAALTPVILAAFYSKRVTPWGAVAAIATGTVVTVVWDQPAVKVAVSADHFAERRDLPGAVHSGRRDDRRQPADAETKRRPTGKIQLAM